MLARLRVETVYITLWSLTTHVLVTLSLVKANFWLSEKMFSYLGVNFFEGQKPVVEAIFFCLDDNNWDPNVWPPHVLRGRLQRVVPHHNHFVQVGKAVESGQRVDHHLNHHKCVVNTRTFSDLLTHVAKFIIARMLIVKLKA